MTLPGGDHPIERTARPAPERQHAVGFAFEPIALDVRLLVDGVSR